MNSTGFRGRWYDRRLPAWVRGLLVLAAGLGVLLSAQAIVDGYRATVVYRQAPVCDREGCVRPETAEVRDRQSGERCTSTGTSGGTAAAGGTATTGGGSSCTTTYSLRVSWSDRSEWLEVGHEAYAEARPGDRVRLRLWEGSVVRLEVGTHIRTYPPASQTDMWPWMALAWSGLAVAAWALASARPIALLPLGVAWFMLSVLILMIGPAVLVWSPLVFCGALAALTVGMALGARATNRY
ncbi:hypothetical protein [Streptomyces sp. NBC_01546]|uniref:hypothetical protein n=1 Tax=Streptomyces sp. NBC_01546 TaxID=2975872 RepID=UPI00386B28CC